MKQPDAVCLMQVIEELVKKMMFFLSNNFNTSSNLTLKENKYYGLNCLFIHKSRDGKRPLYNVAGLYFLLL